MHPQGLDELEDAPARDSEATAETGSDVDGARGCGGAPLAVTFYDAGQALAALVTLPDSRRVLVEAQAVVT